MTPTRLSKSQQKYVKTHSLKRPSEEARTPFIGLLTNEEDINARYQADLIAAVEVFNRAIAADEEALVKLTDAKSDLKVEENSIRKLAQEQKL